MWHAWTLGTAFADIVLARAVGVDTAVIKSALHVLTVRARELLRLSARVRSSLLMPVLGMWGKNDPFFIPPLAEAFKRDLPEADIRFFDTGHFALETHAKQIGAMMREFLAISSADRQAVPGCAACGSGPSTTN
jgi:pimeloyl-ACP methyl ester carboxylesterase